MTDREQILIKFLLAALDEREGLHNETILHFAVDIKAGEHVTLTEFNTALKYCDTQGWLISIQSKLGGTRWKINDHGRAARAEL